ncbi:hypothetical protein D3C87_1053650 [compost metagenome]
MLRVFEKQVSAERNLVADRPAQQVHQRHVQRMRLQIEERHFERRVSVAHRFARMGTGGQFRAGKARRFVRRHSRLNDGAQLIEVERVKADQLALQLLLDRQRRSVAVTLTQTDVAIVAFDLDDRTQRKGFVNAAGVEQWRITEGDGGDGDSFDFQEAAPVGSDFRA